MNEELLPASMGIISAEKTENSNLDQISVRVPGALQH